MLAYPIQHLDGTLLFRSPTILEAVAFILLSCALNVSIETVCDFCHRPDGNAFLLSAISVVTSFIVTNVLIWIEKDDELTLLHDAEIAIFLNLAIVISLPIVTACAGMLKKPAVEAARSTVAAPRVAVVEQEPTMETMASPVGRPAVANPQDAAEIEAPASPAAFYITRSGRKVRKPNRFMFDK